MPAIAVFLDRDDRAGNACRRYDLPVVGANSDRDGPRGVQGGIGSAPARNCTSFSTMRAGRNDIGGEPTNPATNTSIGL